MGPKQRLGVVLILVGLALPMVAFLFVTPEPTLFDTVRWGTIIFATRSENEEEAASRAKSWCEEGYRAYMRTGGFSLKEFAEMECVTDQAKTKQVIPRLALKYRSVVALSILMLFIGVGLVILGKAKYVTRTDT